MNIFKELFFSLEFISAPFQLVKIILFLVLGALIVYLFLLVLSKYLFRKTHLHSDFRLPQTLLWSIILFFIFFSIYIGLIINFYGFDNIPWDNFKLYIGFYKPLSIIHLELLYIGTIVYFILRRRNLLKSFKNQ